MSRLTFLLLPAFFISACTHHSSDNKNEGNKHDHAEVAPVQLNNGERWEANKETTDGINTMISLITTFQEQQSEDYPALKEKLQLEFNTIFQKCTMKGEAHNQLHNFLIPVKKELDNFSSDNISELRSYLNTYSNYFK